MSGKGYDKVTGKFNRGGVIYFDLYVDEYDLPNDVCPNTLEFQAMAEIGEMFDREVYNEGHDRYGTLICKVWVDTYAEMVEVYDTIEDNKATPEGRIYLNEYAYVQSFNLCPDATTVNGRWYGDADRATGDLVEWIEEFKPTDKGL